MTWKKPLPPSNVDADKVRDEYGSRFMVLFSVETKPFFRLEAIHHAFTILFQFDGWDVPVAVRNPTSRRSI